MKVKFNLDSKRITEAIAEGKILQEKMSIDIDLEPLSKEQRELISRNVVFSGGEFHLNLADMYGYSRSVSFYSNSETLEGILKDMQEGEKRLSDRELKIKAFEQKRSKVEEIISRIDQSILTIEYSESSVWAKAKKFQKYLYSDKSNIDLVLEYVQGESFKDDFEGAIYEYNDRLEKERLAEKEKSEKLIAVEKGKEELKEWAVRNGSDLLKGRAANNFNWLEIAQKEWALANSKGLDPDFDEKQLDKADNCWEVKNPTLEQINAFELAKKENPDSKIGVQRYKFINLYYDEVDYKTLLSCEVETPVGTTVLYKEI